MRTGKKTCHDIAQHNGLFQHLEDNGGDGTQHKDECQVTDQTIDIKGFHDDVFFYMFISLVIVMEMGSLCCLISLKRAGTLTRLVLRTMKLTMVKPSS